MLKIFDNYYLDASSVCYMLKKAHVKGDGKLEYDVCTYHTRLEEALAEAERRGLREGVAGEKLQTMLWTWLWRTETIVHK